MKDYPTNIDDLGRIVIPKEIRRINNINVGDLLSVKVTPEGIQRPGIMSARRLNVLRDVQCDIPFAYCDRCGGEIYEERESNIFGAIFCEECEKDLRKERDLAEGMEELEDE